MRSKYSGSWVKIEFNCNSHSYNYITMSQPLLVLVTGANQGIGYYTAQHLASSGKYRVLMGARSLAKAEEAVKKLSQDKSIPSNLLESIEVNLCSDDSIAAAAKRVKDKHGHLDILINNAAIAGGPNFKGTETEREMFQEIYDTNVAGTAVLTDAFLPLLKASKAPSPARRIVFVSSELSSMTLAATGRTSLDYRHYSCSKAALNRLALEYTNSLKDDDITVVTTSPGFCSTNLNGYIGTRAPEDGATEIVYAATEQENGTFMKGGNIVPW